MLSKVFLPFLVFVIAFLFGFYPSFNWYGPDRTVSYYSNIFPDSGYFLRDILEIQRQSESKSVGSVLTYSLLKFRGEKPLLTNILYPSWSLPFKFNHSLAITLFNGLICFVGSGIIFYLLSQHYGTFKSALMIIILLQTPWLHALSLHLVADLFFVIFGIIALLAYGFSQELANRIYFKFFFPAVLVCLLTRPIEAITVFLPLTLRGFWIYQKSNNISFDSIKRQWLYLFLFLALLTSIFLISYGYKLNNLTRPFTPYVWLAIFISTLGLWYFKYRYKMHEKFLFSLLLTIIATWAFFFPFSDNLIHWILGCTIYTGEYGFYPAVGRTSGSLMARISFFGEYLGIFGIIGLFILTLASLKEALKKRPYLIYILASLLVLPTLSLISKNDDLRYFHLQFLVFTLFIFLSIFKTKKFSSRILGKIVLACLIFGFLKFQRESLYREVEMSYHKTFFGYTHISWLPSRYNIMNDLEHELITKVYQGKIQPISADNNCGYALDYFIANLHFKERKININFKECVSSAEQLADFDHPPDFYLLGPLKPNTEGFIIGDIKPLSYFFPCPSNMKICSENINILNKIKLRIDSFQFELILLKQLTK